MARVTMDGVVHAQSDLVKRQSVTMEYFLQTRKLDQATAEMLVKYDKDGNGVFSKDEVAAIVVDLRDAMQHNEELTYYNKLFKRLLIAAVFFAIFLLTGMFCLSYVVAVMTANTKVQNDGVMLTKDGSSKIATDSVATMFDYGNHEGSFCIPDDQAALITQQVFDGRNVLMKFGDAATGNNTIYHLRAAGSQTFPDGTVCFPTPETNDYTCIVPKPEGCTAVDSNGRRLDGKERRLDSNYDQAYNDCVDYAKGICGYDGTWTEDLEGYKNECLTFCGCTSSSQLCYCTASGYDSTKCSAVHQHVCTSGGSQACSCQASPCAC